jgi:hypothetical protein
MRQLLQTERPLVEYLFELAGLSFDASEVMVLPMADGGMGSLAIAPIGSGRQLGSSPAECHFLTGDGVLVSAVLNLDKDGKPLEIDVWRVDFKSVVAWPSREDLVAGPPNSSLKRTNQSLRD